MENTLFDNEPETGKTELTPEIITFIKEFAEMERGSAPSVGLTETWIIKAREILKSINIKFKFKQGY